MRPGRIRPTDGSTADREESREVSEAVLLRLKRGEISALDEVISLYGERVFGVCFGILAQRADAEDATQEVFLRVFQQAAKFSGRSRFSTWLLRLATNHTINIARATSRREGGSQGLDEDLAAPGPGPEHVAMGRERREALAQLLQEIPLEQRQVLVLREMEGLCYAELAEVLGIPIGTVTSRLIRGRERLRALVQESGQNLLSPG